MSATPLIAHVLYRLDTGGMEHMLVTLINHTSERYRHAVICLSEYGPLRDRIESKDVQCIALHKRSGKDFGCYVRLWKVLRRLRPDLVHTLNFGTLDAAPLARLAGVRHVVHGERGRTVEDPRGQGRKYRRLRRWVLPFVDRYLTVSEDLQRWLVHDVGIPPARVACIPNGIDLGRFASAPDVRSTRPALGFFAPPGTFLVGTVGRLDAVKDQAGLIRSFMALCERLPHLRERLRLVLVGDGPERAALAAQIAESGVANQVRLLGERADVATLLPEFDIFALSSVGEGMPGAILEAMACGLPVVATSVGGVGEVVADGVTGRLVSARDSSAFAAALADYATDVALCARHGAAARARVEAQFSLQTMVGRYIAFYDGLLGVSRHPVPQRVTSALAGRREN